MNDYLLPLLHTEAQAEPPAPDVPVEPPESVQPPSTTGASDDVTAANQEEPIDNGPVPQESVAGASGGSLPSVWQRGIDWFGRMAKRLFGRH